MSSEVSRVARKVMLADYNTGDFHRGRSAWIEGIWIVLQALLIASFIPGSIHRRALLRIFGAQIGYGVVLKPGLRIKFPWRLTIGNDTWIGEHVWIDNLAPVSIGSNCCISQDAYICTGSHDWRSPVFSLITSSISIHDSAWVAARAVIGPGTNIGEGAIVTAGSVVSGRLKPWTIYQGNPAIKKCSRELSQDSS